jgi:hypothetical protein
MLNIDVTGAAPATPASEEISGALLGEGFGVTWRRKETPFGEILAKAEPLSILGVCGLPSENSPEIPKSVSPRFSSSSSLISPRTRLTILPTTSSRGWAAISRFPTS